MDDLNLSTIITELASRDERIASMCARLVLIVHQYRAVHVECFCEAIPPTMEVHASFSWVCQRCDREVPYAELVFPPVEPDQYAQDVVYLLSALSEVTEALTSFEGVLALAPQA